MSDQLLQVTGLHATVGAAGRQLPILRGVDLAVDAGETLAVVGESGSGKSFTALSIAGLLPDGARITAGEVRLAGEDLVRMPEPSRRRSRGAEIAIVYQDPMTSLNPVLRIGTQVMEALTAHGWSRTDARDRTLEVLAEVGLPTPRKLIKLYPHQLSGGMRQRVLIACAIAPRPKVLIADEPTTALDVTIQQQIIELVGRLGEEYGLAVIWITHDLGVVGRIADRISVMYAGRIVETADTLSIFTRPSHPYTAGLLASLPGRDDPHQQPLPQIGGVPVSITDLPPGCPFADRCPQVIGICRSDEPGLIDRDTSLAACHVPPQDWRPVRTTEEVADV
jgi:oligopeptide/dipeptide ABC transporter ATP-binding protein